jgi:hypothetical protein
MARRNCTLATQRAAHAARATTFSARSDDVPSQPTTPDIAALGVVSAATATECSKTVSCLLARGAGQAVRHAEKSCGRRRPAVRTAGDCLQGGLEKIADQTHVPPT